MFGFAKRSAARRQAQAVRDQDQLEYYAKLSQVAIFQLVEDKAGGPPAAATANWIMRFGDYGPEFEGDLGIELAVVEQLKHLGGLLSDDDRAQMTMGLLASAALGSVPLEQFKRHFDVLCDFCIVRKGINIPGAEELHRINPVYYYYILYGDLGDAPPK
jgi:hypothetical protein